MMMPRLMWPLSIYNVPLTTVELLQRKITASLKKWLKLPKSLSNACFYSKSSKLKLPYSPLSGHSHHTLCCSVAASCGSDLCSTNYSKLCYFAIYLHGESLSEQLTNAIIQLRVRSKLHQRQQRLKHLHRLPNAITTLVILNPLLHGY